MVIFEVGKPLPKEIRELWMSRGAIDGAILEVWDKSFVLNFYLKDMTDKEVFAFNNEKMKIKILEEENMVLTMVRFGETPLVFELSFDPTLYGDDRAIRALEHGSLLHVTGIDSRTGIVKTLRAVSIPSKLVRVWSRKWKLALEEVENYSEKYKSWVDSFAENEVLTNWDRALYVGRFGESYWDN